MPSSTFVIVQQGLQLSSASSLTNVSELKASFSVADCIAKVKMPFIISKELISLAAKDICSELFWEAVVKKAANIPLLTNTITEQIDEIAEDVEAQMLERISESLWYAIQVDKYTDVNLAV